MFVKSGASAGQAVSPHAGELSVGEQRGGFSGFAHAADPLLRRVSKPLRKCYWVLVFSGALPTSIIIGLGD